MKNVKIMGKLLVLVIPLVVALIASSLFYSAQMNSVLEDAKTTYKDNLYVINDTLIQADRDLFQAFVAAMEYRGDRLKLSSEELAALNDTYEGNIQKVFDRVESVVKVAKQDSYFWTGVTASDGQNFESLYNGYIAAIMQWKGTYDVVNNIGTFELYEERFDHARSYLAGMVEVAVKWAENEDQKLQSSIKQTIMVSILLFLVISAILFVVAILMSRSIAKSMKDMTGRLEILAQNDLSQEQPKVNQKDEIGQMLKAFGTMQENLTNVIGTLKTTTDGLAESCNVMESNTEEAQQSMSHINNAASELAETATQQAGDVSDVSKSMDDLGSVMHRSVKTAEALNDASTQIHSVTSAGVQTVEGLTKINQQSLAAFDTIFKAIANIQDSSDKISGASALISSVAEQTNLLSLNASIEAARAGDAGKGFAVVAEEIRKLSDESANSVETINSLLAELQANTKNAIEKSNYVKDLVDQQNVSVQETRGSFDHIVDAAHVVEQAIEEIHNINGELDTGIRNITSLVDNLSAASEENAATAQELSATADIVARNVEELRNTQGLVNGASEDLESIIHKFKLAENEAIASYAELTEAAEETEEMEERSIEEQLPETEEMPMEEGEAEEAEFEETPAEEYGENYEG